MKEVSEMKFSSKIEKCGLSPMRKFHPYAVAAEAKGRKIYHLNIGQPDIETPQAFFDAVKDFKQPVLAYAPSPGVPAYIKAVKDYYAKLGIQLDDGDILATTGGSEALQMVLTCILDDGDNILIPEPFYPNYNTFTRVTGGYIKPIPTKPEEGYHYADRAKIEAAIDEHTRAIMVTNPGNPTGVVLTHEEMRMIADIAKEHDLFIIGDEVYREFVYGGEGLASLAEFPDAAENVIIIDSVSKRFSACGARIGVLISRNKELMAQAMKLCQGRLCSATLDQVGAAALYTVGPEYFAAVRDEYKKRRDTVVAKLKAIPGVVCECPKGAFYLMAALPVDNADTFNKWLLEEFEDHGDTVMFAPGESFYATQGKGKNEIRIAYVLKQADLERAMDLLALGIKAYNARK
jgi:aspartate aminotransferase